MLRLRGALVVCFLLLFFSSVCEGFFGKKRPKPTAQSKEASGIWGGSYFGKWIPEVKLPIPPLSSLGLPLNFLPGTVEGQVATTLQNPTTESPPTNTDIMNIQYLKGSLRANVATTVQNPPTKSQPTSTDTANVQDFKESLKAQVASTVQNPPTERPQTSANIITSQDYKLSLKTDVVTTVQNLTTGSPPISADIINVQKGNRGLVMARLTTPSYQSITVVPSDNVTTTPAPKGTVLPQRGTRPPKDELLRARHQTDNPKPILQPYPSYDLDLWPSNGGSNTEKASTQDTHGYVIITSDSSIQESSTSTTQVSWSAKPTTKSVKLQNAKKKRPQNKPISTTTGFQTSELPSSEPRLHPTPPTPVQSTTIKQQPAVSTSLPTEATTQLQPSPTTTPEDSINPRQAVEDVTAMATVPNWTLETEATDGDPDRFPWSVPTTSEPEVESLSSIQDLPHAALTTEPSAGALKPEATSEESTDPTAAEREKKTSTSMTTSKTTDMPTTASEDWLEDMTQESALPDCNAERSGICSSNGTWAPTYPNDKSSSNNNNNSSEATSSTNHSQTPVLPPSLPMLVPLYSDWNSAMAAWGLAWDAHVYGLGTVFCLISLASALNLLCLPLCCPSGCGYFALVSLFLLAAGCTRAFALLYDAYGHQDRMPSTEASLLLYEAPFPCMTAAFGLVFLLLSMRSRMQLSYSAFQRPCFLACLVLLHFAAAFGPVTLLRVDQQGAPLCLFLSLISRGAFVALATFLSVAYFVFYCYVRADSKHIYHLNNTSPTPAERYNRCPFAESQDWDRAAVAVFLSAIFSLVCAGLQLYAMLHALGVAGGAEVFQPWPWWTFQFSCRVCEAVVCLTLALVVSQPVYCSEHLPQPGNCWMEILAAKSPIIPGSYQWTLTQQEKLAICDPIGHGETECLPLYTLVDDRMGSLNGLDLLYHSNRALAYRDLDLDLPETLPNTGAPSVGSSFTSDSTADLRPPSPINLRRSIDEALFSEALFPMSLFSPMRPFTSSNHSLEGRDTGSSSGQTLKDTHPSDPGLYRTSSCVEMLPQAPLPVPAQQEASFIPSPSPSPTSSCCSSPEHWRGSSSSCSLYRPSIAGSSLVLCSSPEGHNPPPPSTISGSSGHTAPNTALQGSGQQRHYRTQNLEQQNELDQSVQEEFISVCRQIDALSICSETIDL
ncbi:proline-rich transmembrane protein 4 [Astyanax mexicanus]|uniref:proline-rich transmembrane protein 4 n=1 Tax=Astyanax mexicanus TaxID=7994 RepID=UPI0020CB0363|nr:proline-rich transmembrane protein 4 [Astyanax mexicanus]